MIRYILMISGCYFVSLKEGVTNSIDKATVYTLNELPSALFDVFKNYISTRISLLRVSVTEAPEWIPVPDPDNYRWINAEGRISCNTPPGIARRNKLTSRRTIKLLPDIYEACP